MDFKLVYTIVHLIGVALGAGGAYMSDFIFMQSIKDRKITDTEYKFMSLGSRAVWTGLFLLIVSGIGLFSLDSETYLNSSKFQTKMAIVAILTLNGFYFVFAHIPLIKRHRDAHYPSSDEFRRKSVWMMFSGVVSMVSWTSAIILGAMRSIPYTFGQAITFYLIFIFAGFVVSLILKNKILFYKK